MKASHPEVAAAHRINPGETLRKVRESKSLALSDVATQLNLTPQALRNLELGAFEQLPGHTFARGYVRAYARLMGMDGDRLVLEFDQFTGTDASGSSVTSLARIQEPARVSQSLLKGFSVAALLGLGAVGFFWWQGEAQRLADSGADKGFEHVEVETADGTTEIHPIDEPEDQAVAEAQVVGAEEQQPVAAEPVPAELPQLTPAASVDPQAQPAATPALASESAAAAPAAEPVSQAAAQPEPVEQLETPVAPAVPAAPAAGEALVNLQFTADCWTQLTDADGKVLLSALKRRGDSVEMVGKAPLELRLGYARGAVVLVNGQSVDVASSTHGETARLKLGQ